ncbi:extracellular solute-binding protein [Actinomycetaceae bacterium MB13-C1-2]|nr:extracellular solute-binding protein [Actinomycetaceae bacterium MB13-C1-2]
MSRRAKTAQRWIAAVAVVALGGPLLGGCSSGGREEIRFTFSKREAIPFISEVVKDYNSSQDRYEAVLDTSGVDVISASFVRGNPPDLMLANYNFEVSRFVDRCVLTDLSDTQAAASVDLEMFEPLMDQYGQCEGRVSALPYSVMSAAVIYNKEIFAEHDLEIPKTWDELIAVSDKLKQEDVTPFYGTFKDDWTVGQGWFDYTVGGSIDVIEFFDALKAEGTDVGPESAVSFQKDFAEPMDKMTRLIKNYANADADSRSYGDGNLAMAQGKAAMYLQGPWAFNEIAKTSPDLELGTFPLPMTNDEGDLSVRTNIDLAALIPTGSRHQEAARDFLEYLYQPEIIQDYNESQLGFTPTKDAPAPTDPRLAGMIPYYEDGQIFQGASVLIPKAIPVWSYAQAIAMGGDPTEYLEILDNDWARLAFRQPKAE